MRSCAERQNSHTGTETRPRLLREAAVGNIPQWGGTLTEQCRVSDEGLRIVKLCDWGRRADQERVMLDGTRVGSPG